MWLTSAFPCGCDTKERNKLLFTFFLKKWCCALPCFPACSHAEEEDLREVLASGDRAEDDLEVTNFYVNPIAKPIPQGRSQASLQDTISELNMHKTTRNGLEVSRHSPHLEVVRALSRVDLLYDIIFCINNLKNKQARIMS